MVNRKSNISITTYDIDLGKLMFYALSKLSSKRKRKSLREFIVKKRKRKSEKVAECSYIYFAYIICVAFGSIKESL